MVVRVFGETPNTTRETRVLPFQLHVPARSGFIRSGREVSADFARRLRCSSVTDFCEYAPSSRLECGQNPLETLPPLTYETASKLAV